MFDFQRKLKAILVAASVLGFVGCSVPVRNAEDLPSIDRPPVIEVLEVRPVSRNVVEVVFDVENHGPADLCMLKDRAEILTFDGLIEVNDVKLGLNDGSETTLQASAFYSPRVEYISKAGRSRLDRYVVLGSQERINSSIMIRLNYVDSDTGHDVQEVRSLAIQIEAVACSDAIWPEPPRFYYAADVVAEHAASDPSLQLSWRSYWSAPFELD